MQIILHAQCKSLTGRISKKNHFYLRKTKKGIFTVPSNRKALCPREHWKFIRECADCAKTGFPIADIRISRQEITDALREAGLEAGRLVLPKTLNAADIRNVYNQLNFNDDE